MSKLIERIKRHEGCRLELYVDTLGNRTIGYGRNITRGIHQDEAELMFQNDLKFAETAAQYLPGYHNCNYIRQEVLIEMIFQLGFRGVLNFRKMISAIEKKDFVKAAEEMIDSRWYLQTPDRCNELANLMMHGNPDDLDRNENSCGEGIQISRKEALAISQKILMQAEQERLEIAESEAIRGIDDNLE